MTVGLALFFAANLVALGDFEAERPARDYGFHAYGAGRGSSGHAQAGEKGGWCARLAMERGPVVCRMNAADFPKDVPLVFEVRPRDSRGRTGRSIAGQLQRNGQ